ncbi:MAG: cytochrome c-type biogenesis protein [Alphaproteobacteria bacterium]
MKVWLFVMMFVAAISGQASGLLEKEQHITSQLRCPTCIAQTLSESSSDIANDIRKIIHDKLIAGETEAQILDYIGQHYGEQVFLNPPFKPFTYILWLSPIFILLLGFLMLWRSVFRNWR